MTVHYVDTSQGSNGTGSQANPYNTIASVTSATDDTVLLKTGTTIAASTVPAGLLTPAGVTVGEYGTGAKPIISAGVSRADFSASAQPGIWQRTYASNTVGNVVENGSPMTFVAFDTDLATTAALMSAGSFSFDYSGFVLYIKPAFGSLSEYSVGESSYCLTNNQNSSGLILRNLHLKQANRHSLLLYNKRNFSVSGVDINVSGGLRSGAYHLGNGYEFSSGCVNGEIADAVIEDVFDSAFTSQLYEAVPARISDHHYQNIVARRCGLSAAEVSIQSTAKQWVENITVADVTAENIGKNCWSGNRGGWGMLTVATACLGNGKVSRCTFDRVVVTNAQKLIASASTSGVNGWRDCVGTGITSDSTATTLYGAGQADLLLNVLSNGVAPNGGAFSAAAITDYAATIF